MGVPLRVLIVEDSEDDTLLLVRALQRGGYDLTFNQVETAAAMKDAIAQRTWDIVIADYRMPHFSGLEALTVLNESGLDLPFIILSGAIGEEAAVETMRAGAQDYIMKSNPARLVPAVARELSEAELRRERKWAGEEIVRTNSELQEAVAKLKESQTQLLQSAKLAAIGSLVSGVTHELNNPLAAISMHAELLLEEVNDGEEGESVRMINAEANRAIKIVQNLLTFARKHKPEKRSISINEVLACTIDLRAYDLNLDNVKVVSDLDPDLPETMADFHQLQQVFLNLINNAEQAVKQAQSNGRLVIRTQRVDEMIRVTFADNGPGIPADNLDRVFEPFFTTKDVGEGTGLGLSICYGIIQEHDGQIHVESREGAGATFVVEIPAIPEADGCSAHLERTKTPRSATGARRKSTGRTHIPAK